MYEPGKPNGQSDELIANQNNVISPGLGPNPQYHQLPNQEYQGQPQYQQIIIGQNDNAYPGNPANMQYPSNMMNPVMGPGMGGAPGMVGAPGGPMGYPAMGNQPNPYVTYNQQIYPTSTKSRKPEQIYCLRCQKVVITSVSTELGSGAWQLGCLMWCFGCGLCALCCCCCNEDWKDVTHTCPECSAFLGINKFKL